LHVAYVSLALHSLSHGPVIPDDIVSLGDLGIQIPPKLKSVELLDVSVHDHEWPQFWDLFDWVEDLTFGHYILNIHRTTDPGSVLAGFQAVLPNLRRLRIGGFSVGVQQSSQDRLQGSRLEELECTLSMLPFTSPVVSLRHLKAYFDKDITDVRVSAILSLLFVGLGCGTFPALKDLELIGKTGNLTSLVKEVGLQDKCSQVGVHLRVMTIDEDSWLSEPEDDEHEQHLRSFVCHPDTFR
jgi:hypothetical protein